MKKIITAMMIGMMTFVGINVNAATDLSNPYTWSEAQCIMFGLLGFAAVIIGLIFLAAMLCMGIRFLRELFHI